MKAFEDICPLWAVQIVRLRNGSMASFCLIEVYNKDIAQELMIATKGKVKINGKEATLFYSKRDKPIKCDWTCDKVNFIYDFSVSCFKLCIPL